MRGLSAVFLSCQLSAMGLQLPGLAGTEPRGPEVSTHVGGDSRWWAEFYFYNKMIRKYQVLC